MIGTEFLDGQGLGNQLFCYISARCIAEDLGESFGTAGQERLAVNVHSKKGMYFMNLDLGKDVTDPESCKRYDEKEKRIYINDCVHDLVHGCYIAGTDEGIYDLQGGDDTVLIYGNMQSERYFGAHRDEICSWMKVRPEYDSDEYTSDDICVMNMRGGEYYGEHELFVEKKYWTDAMKYMKSIRSDMRFVIVTDDVEAAGKLFPKIPAHHSELAKDYVTVKNARYLILSNSSFGFFPAYTSTTVKKIIAPKYWARHNVSDGFWASEQNIYSIFSYMDRDGKLFTPEECRRELTEYIPDKHKYIYYDEPLSEDSEIVKKQIKKDASIDMRQKVRWKLDRMFGK